MYSGYIWKEYADNQKRGTLSVRLEQVKVKEVEIGFFFMVMSDKLSEEGMEESGSCCCDMVQWFHRRILLKLQRSRSGKTLKHLGEELMEYLQEYSKRSRGLHAGCILLLNNQIWYQCFGEMQLYIVNRRYTKGKIRLLDNVAEGVIQKGVGLWMTTSHAMQGLDPQELCDCLVLGKGRSSKNVDNRMKNVEELMDEESIAEQDSLYRCREKGAIFVFYE